MTKKRKVVISLLIIAGALALVWKNSVMVTGYATPGTCKVETADGTKQLSIEETYFYVNEEISAKRNLQAESVSCTLWPSSDKSSEDLNMIGLTSAAQFMWDNVDERFGFIPYGGFAPGGVDSGHSSNSSHYKGKAIDFFFNPYKKDSEVAKGWTFANWAVANAERLAIATVIYQDRIWTRNSSYKGWETFVPTYGDPKNPTIRHLDHVHVDVN
jgi:hypothetical protein